MGLRAPRFEPSRDNPKLYAVDYDAVFVRTVRDALLSVNPDVIYVDSSPSKGVLSQAPYVKRCGALCKVASLHVQQTGKVASLHMQHTCKVAFLDTQQTCKVASLHTQQSTSVVRGTLQSEQPISRSGQLAVLSICSLFLPCVGMLCTCNVQWCGDRADLW